MRDPWPAAAAALRAPGAGPGASLELDHPTRGDRVHFTAAWPADLAAILAAPR